MLGTELLNAAMVQLNSFIQNKQNFVSLQRNLLNISEFFNQIWCTRWLVLCLKTLTYSIV